MPENTIAAAKNALKLGTTIEMDLYMSKDSQLVVTHDPHIMTKYYHSLIRFQQCAQKNKKEKLFKISPFRHLSS